MITQKTFFALAFSFLVMVSSQAMDSSTGNPMFPVPLANDFVMGCCHQNAFLQCLLQCPKFCWYINQIEKPTNKLRAALKLLRDNRLLLIDDESILLPFFQYDYFRPEHSVLMHYVLGCSIEPCRYIWTQMKADFKKNPGDLSVNSLYESFLYEYIFLKQIFRLSTFYYSDQQRIVLRLKKIEFVAAEHEYSHIPDGYCKHVNFGPIGFDFMYINVPILDLFVVKCLFSPEMQDKLKSDVDILNNIILPLETFFSSEIGKNCKLGAISFITQKTLEFVKKPDCNKVMWQYQLNSGTLWANGKLSELVGEVREVHDDSVVHCAAYVNHKDAWYFCDDFYRACLQKPLLRKIQGEVKDVLTDLVVNEQGGDEVLFFWANS